MNVRQLLSGSVFAPASGLLLALSLAAVAEAQYPEGQIVEIKGAITDAHGTAAAGKTVRLEVYRRAFDLSSLNPRSSKKKGLVLREVETDDQGRYLIRWPWHDYYNRFELSVGDYGAEGFAVLERADLSQRMKRGSPVIVSFLLRREPSSAPALAAGASTQVTSIAGASAAQRAIRNRQGEPDLIDHLDLAYGRETTWWYFRSGRAYRFLDGELSDELTFQSLAN
jgi:hypothetical protein